jgi:3-oxoacyl-[acyl-carrier protein] reductase
VRRVLVTGGSGGLGRAIAAALGRDGFEVTVAFRRNKAAAEQTAGAIVEAGGRARTLAFDVEDRTECATVLGADLATHGPFWGIVCNAGLHADAAFPSLSAEQWDRVLRTNLDGFYNVVHPLVMPLVRARNGGRIVTISSVAGLVGNRGQVNYSAAKAGLIGATKALAHELAKRDITVNSVAPGLIDTEMAAGAPVEEILRMIPMRRLGRADEVAATVSFLFSDGAAYITGQVISVNGGLV